MLPLVAAWVKTPGRGSHPQEVDQSIAQLALCH
jgi:hypothetical protein